MKVFRSSCRRRVLITAFLPYLLLSVFVDFVHLHPLLSGTVPQISAVKHVAACTGPTSRTGDSPCAIGQWLRAGTGIQPAVSAPLTPVMLSAAFVARLPVAPLRPDLCSPAFRGPRPLRSDERRPWPDR